MEQSPKPLKKKSYPTLLHVSVHVRKSGGRRVFRCPSTKIKNLHKKHGLGYHCFMAKKKDIPKLAPRPVALLEKIISGDTGAWQSFVRAYSGFIWSIACRYSRGDRDLASELFLAALEGLRRPDTKGQAYYRLRKYLDSLDKFGKRSRFTTWLALVIKNIFRDWFRQTQGRRWIPKEILELDEKAQALFKALVFDALTQTQAQTRLKSLWPHMGPDEFDSILEEVQEVFKKKSLWTLYRELLQRLPPSPLDHTGAGDGGYYPPDSRPMSRPDLALEIKQRHQLAKHIHQMLMAAIESLPQKQRMVLELTSIQGFTGEQVKKIMGFRHRQKVYDLLANARQGLKRHLEKQGIDSQIISEVTGYMEHDLRNLFSPTSTRSHPGFRQDTYESKKKRGGLQ